MNNHIRNPLLLREKDKLNMLYRQFGEKVFTEMRNRDENVSSEKFFEDLMNSAMEFCVEITDSIKRIEEYNNSNVPEVTPSAGSAAKKATKSCPRCGELCEDDMRFCIACGFELSSDNSSSSADAQKTLFCTKCGTVLDSDSVFCTTCGQRIDF